MTACHQCSDAYPLTEKSMLLPGVLVHALVFNLSTWQAEAVYRLSSGAARPTKKPHHAVHPWMTTVIYPCHNAMESGDV